MKKRIAIVLALVMMVSLIIACGGGGNDSALEGDWSLSYMEYDGMSIRINEDGSAELEFMGEIEELDAEMMALFGFEITFTFNSDGTGRMNMMGDTLDIDSWETSGNELTITYSEFGEQGSERFTYSVSGRNLTLTFVETAEVDMIGTSIELRRN